MPESSIVIRAEDRYSDAVRKMADTTKAFSAESDHLEDQLYKLNKNKVSLKVDLKDAGAQLKSAEKQFLATRDAADGLQLELAQANYDNIKRNLDTVTRGARQAEKALRDANGGKSGGGFPIKLDSPALRGLLSASVTGLLAPALQETFTTLATSSFGASQGAALSSMLTGAVGGAAMGATLGGPMGGAIGGAVGAAGGALSGIVAREGQKDEAFKSYVQEAVEGQQTAMEEALSSGIRTAGSREQSLVSYTHKFGSQGVAEEFLADVQEMAQDTNFEYDEILGYTKNLLNTYDPKKSLEVLMDLSDVAAGLSLGGSDIDMMVSGLARMRMTNKANAEYLNYFSDRGVDVFAALSRSTGASKEALPDMLSKGQISGTEAADAILKYIEDEFGGLSDRLAETYDAMAANLGDAKANLDARMGEGYNEARKAGITAEQDFLTGESGQKLGDAYEALGAFQASLDNKREEILRSHVDAAMASEAYKTAEAEGDAARMGEIIMRAKIDAQNEYNATEGAQLLRESEKSLIAGVREDTATREEYWNAGYELGELYSMGRAAGMYSHSAANGTPETLRAAGKVAFNQPSGVDTSGFTQPTASTVHQDVRQTSNVNVTGPVNIYKDTDEDTFFAHLAEKVRTTMMGGVAT